MANNTALRFTSTETGLRAIDGDIGFTIYLNKATGTYRLRVWSLTTIDGDKFLNDVIDTTHADLQRDAKGIAAAYAADTDRPVYLGRMTHAVATYFDSIAEARS